ncbi:hypothetical protein FS837_012638 [Tulasnella sp. UAMH 9824]|nr:hypothetical protein FS837_012638 [Tulasnella sp. UAMH 9824]
MAGSIAASTVVSTLTALSGFLRTFPETYEKTFPLSADALTQGREPVSKRLFSQSSRCKLGLVCNLQRSSTLYPPSTPPQAMQSLAERFAGVQTPPSTAGSRKRALSDRTAGTVMLALQVATDGGLGSSATLARKIGLLTMPTPGPEPEDLPEPPPPDCKPARLTFSRRGFAFDELLRKAAEREAEAALHGGFADLSEAEDFLEGGDLSEAGETPVEEPANAEDLEKPHRQDDPVAPASFGTGGWLPEASVAEGAEAATPKPLLKKRRLRKTGGVKETSKVGEGPQRLLFKSLLAKALKHAQELDLQALPHSSSSYLGPQGKAGTFKTARNPASSLREAEGAAAPTHHMHPRLQELLAQGYDVITSHSAPDLIFDGSARLCAWKPGAFGHSGYWDGLIRGLSRSFKTFAEGIAASRAKAKERSKGKRPQKASGGTPRGPHAWTRWGYSIGGGEKLPMSTSQPRKKERELWKGFLACPFFKAVTEHLMESFEMWAPEIHQKYDECHKHILSQLKALDCIDPSSALSVPFAALTANLGPQTVCWPHQDSKNLSSGVCLILVLGSFNHRYGGHIVLHEARIIVEMKPGDALFLPSAVITHENIPIQAEETRYSLVFYSAGGLFRWKDCGSQTNKAFEAQDKEAFAAHFSEAKAQERWKAGLDGFPTLEALKRRASAKPHPQPMRYAPAISYLKESFI